MTTVKSITSWDAAAKLVGANPENLPNVDQCEERLKKFTVGMYKRAIVCEALNKAYGIENNIEEKWVQDYSDWNQLKYYPWAEPGKDDKVPSGFGFSRADCDYTDAGTYVGSRLVLRDDSLVFHMLDTPEFREILVDTMVIQPTEE